MYTMFSDTIAAISTPHGKGGVAVIRISGEDAFTIAEKFIFPKNKKSFSEMRANSVFLADVKTPEGKLLDESLITIFRAPRSYTGENVVEISCHGGILLTQNILSAAFSAGAVQAGPGEFTRRAFSAGKLSLTEAESVIGMIDAKTNAALSLAQRGISGSLHKKTEKIYTDITSVIGNIYAIIDFPDEDLEQMTRNDMENAMDSIIAELDSLKKSYRTGHAVCEGIPTVICGKPNTGKSTILNLLAENERAIVTDIAGTTRDVISETVVCGSALLRLSDTAGIRESADIVEQIGVERSRKEIKNSELILAVFDTSRPFDEEDEEVLALIGSAQDEGKTVIVILNKQDKEKLFGDERFEGFDTISISAKTEDRKALSDKIERKFISGDIENSGEEILTNARQYSSVCDCLASVVSAKYALSSFGDDIAGTELERAASAISELDGREVSVDVVDHIFHKFCVGK
ncbi:MAG: tRNA uridine-5-carboxymethylaminomethyl(34) synthesis GTPase MnmE [Clostridia bacterium]|nr:tRNA uridine-5-carboxymethylaminomethyl(34) synthesis GTPase MnmE [Clostridia bacterium]